MTVQEFREKLRSQDLRSGYFLIGESFQREEALRVLLDFLLPPEARGLNLEVLWGEEVDPVRFTSSLRTMPMHAGRRVLVVRSCEGMGKEVWKQLPSVLKGAPPSSTCIIFSGEKADKKLLPKDVLNVVFWAEFEPLRGQRLMRWLAERAGRLGKQLSREATELLVAHLGEDLWALAGELEKLSSYVGKRKRIEARDVQEVSGAWTVRVFQLADAVGAGDVRGSAVLLRHVLEAGQPANLVLSLLRRHWEVLAKLALLRPKVKARSRLAAEAGISQYFLDRYLRHVEGRSKEEIARGMRAILEAEHRLRSGRREAEVVLDLLVRELCGGKPWKGS